MREIDEKLGSIDQTISRIEEIISSAAVDSCRTRHVKLTKAQRTIVVAILLVASVASLALAGWVYHIVSDDARDEALAVRMTNVESEVERLRHGLIHP